MDDLIFDLTPQEIGGLIRVHGGKTRYSLGFLLPKKRLFKRCGPFAFFKGHNYQPSLGIGLLNWTSRFYTLLIEAKSYFHKSCEGWKRQIFPKYFVLLHQAMEGDINKHLFI